MSYENTSMTTNLKSSGSGDKAGPIAFAGVMLGAILTAVGREHGGRPFLIALAIVFVTIAFWLGRRAVLSAR